MSSIIKSVEISKADIIEIQQDIEHAKVEKAQAEGEQKAIMKQLQEEWDCKTIGEAEERIKKIKDEIDMLNSQIAVRLEKIREVYDI